MPWARAGAAATDTVIDARDGDRHGEEHREVEALHVRVPRRVGVPRGLLERRAERVVARARQHGTLVRYNDASHAAEHRDTERAAELAGRVVHRRADARLVERERLHDRAGRRRGDEPHAGRGHDERDARAAGSRVHATARQQRESGGDDDQCRS